MNSNSLFEHPRGLGRAMYQLKLNIVKCHKIFRSLRKLMYKISINCLSNSVNFTAIIWIVLMY